MLKLSLSLVAELANLTGASQLILEKIKQAGELAQWVRVLAA